MNAIINRLRNNTATNRDRRTLAFKAPTMNRTQLKAVATVIQGYPVYGLKIDIVEKVRDLLA